MVWITMLTTHFGVVRLNGIKHIFQQRLIIAS